MAKDWLEEIAKDPVGAFIGGLYKATKALHAANVVAAKKKARRMFWLKVMQAGVWTLLLIMLAGSVLLAHYGPEGSFRYLLSAEIFGGVATFTIFLFLEVVLGDPSDKSAAKRYIAANWSALVLALIFGGIAYNHLGIVRDLSLELSVGIILAVVLETWLKHDVISKMREIDQLEKAQKVLAHALKHYPGLWNQIGNPELKKAMKDAASRWQ
ncbi:MAG TPA: hypothetical protein VKB67_13375 [Rhizomicrobium sp.]|nr:hypothetical protein [Rhizomicrobium sp.]